MLMAHWQQQVILKLRFRTDAQMDYYRFCGSIAGFITPVDGDIEHMLTFMRDLHVIRRAIWAMSGCGR